jgi:hypothetical protein
MRPLNAAAAAYSAHPTTFLFFFFLIQRETTFYLISFSFSSGCRTLLRALFFAHTCPSRLNFTKLKRQIKTKQNKKKRSGWESEKKKKERKRLGLRIVPSQSNVFLVSAALGAMHQVRSVLFQ